MRKLVRRELSRAHKSYLARKQSEVGSGRNVETLWKHSRKTKMMKGVFQALARMAGVRARCMYCEDSRGTTI